MRKKLFLLPALLLVASVMFVSSCKKDCSFDQNDYAGSYGVVEDCTLTANTGYVVTILKGASETSVQLVGFWGTGNFVAPIQATIDCENITIARQEPDGDKFFVEGSGTISKDNDVTTITLTYTVTDEDVTPFNVDRCNATIYTKQ